MTKRHIWGKTILPKFTLPKDIYIRPKLPFEIVGGALGVKLNPKRVYRASVAINQPNYESRGKVFVSVKQKRGTGDFLLEKGDYNIVTKKGRKLKKVI